MREAQHGGAWTHAAAGLGGEKNYILRSDLKDPAVWKKLISANTQVLVLKINIRQIVAPTSQTI